MYSQIIFETIHRVDMTLGVQVGPLPGPINRSRLKSLEKTQHPSMCAVEYSWDMHAAQISHSDSILIYIIKVHNYALQYTPFLYEPASCSQNKINNAPKSLLCSFVTQV